jgi:hypothetical protein
MDSLVGLFCERIFRGVDRRQDEVSTEAIDILSINRLRKGDYSRLPSNSQREAL